MTFLAFRTAARVMATEAQTHRELLVKHGLSETVLEQFVRCWTSSTRRWRWARRAGPPTRGDRELKAVADRILQTVRVMDGRVRQRFAGRGQVAGVVDQRSRCWDAARGGSAPEPGKVEPAPEGR